MSERSSSSRLDDNVFASTTVPIAVARGRLPREESEPISAPAWSRAHNAFERWLPLSPPFSRAHRVEEKNCAVVYCCCRYCRRGCTIAGKKHAIRIKIHCDGDITRAARRSVCWRRVHATLTTVSITHEGRWRNAGKATSKCRRGSSSLLLRPGSRFIYPYDISTRLTFAETTPCIH